jgi:MFS transporter, SHS family, lactate transporter
MAHPAPSLAGGANVPWWREPTRAQWINFLAAWAGWVLDGFDFCIFLFAMKDIAAEFHQSIPTTASLVTLTLVVRLAGGLLGGWLADRAGRRLPLMISILWFAACDGAVAFAPTFTAVVVLRTLFGLGMGAEWTSGAALAMESWPARTRGLASGVLQGSWGLGYALAAFAYAAVGPAHWRTLFLLAALPALLVVPIRLMVKEERRPARAPAADPAARPAAPGRGLVLRVVWACVLYAASFAIYNALTGMWPTLLMKGVGLAPAALRVPALLFNLGMLGGAIAVGVAASRVGVVWAQVIPLALLVPVLPLFVGAAPAWLWLGAFLAGSLGAGISGVTPFLFAALFPAEVRARGFGIVYHVGALLAAPVPWLVAWLGDGGRMPLALALAGTAAAGVVLTVAILLLRPRGILPREVLGHRSAGAAA